MASEPESSLSSLIDRLMAMPFLSSVLTAAPEPDSDQDSEHQRHESTDRSNLSPSLDRIILINPLTQGMMVIRGSATGFDSLLNELMTKKDGQPPASQASIDSMARFEIKGTEEIERFGGDCECVICLKEWEVGEVVKEMPCKHRFHGECVEKWLKIHGTCPVCRYKMPVDESDKKPEPESESGSGSGSGRRRREIWVTLSFSNQEPSDSSSPSPSPSTSN